MTLSFLHSDIHLVAIVPDGPLTAKWFGADAGAAMEWALAQTGANVYFTINQTHSGVEIKPTKADILQVRFAHVDIDPPETGPWDRDAALIALLAQNPSVVIDSGNGWQGLWRLTQDDADIEETNRGIAHALGADPRVHNKDRLFRVPGTTNYPNAAKRARGRTPQPTSLILAEPHAFAPETLRTHYPAPARTSRQGVDGGYDGPWEEYDPPLPSNRLRDLLWEDIPTGGRSEHAAKVAHYMGREGYSHAQIMGTLMNPQWPWAGTIQDQADPERQARRKLIGVVVWPKGEDMFPDEDVHPLTLIPPSKVRAAEAGFASRDGGWMPQEEQIRHFKGCVYITSLDKILMPNGTLLNQSRFDSVMGGHKFAIGADTQDPPTKSAWEAFLKNQRYSAPTADERCFRPMEAPLSLLNSGNRVLVNCYVPIDTPRTAGDAGPFLDWLSRCYPVERDRAILLNYLASLLQNPGRKFQWWPVLQSAEGTGKGFLMTLMQFCVGSQYCHLPNTSKMTRNGINFNGWIENKLFIGLNEIYSANRRDFLEELKTTVTDMSIPIEGKGIEEATLDNFANGMMFTNHRDGVPVTVDMRRYCILFMALQTKADIKAAGMDGKFFANFWDWGFGRGAWADRGRDYGFRVMNDYLRSYALTAELDPAQLAQDAPTSSSTMGAVAASMGRAEQEVQEAIEQGLQGFAGGWVSSVMLDRLLDKSRLGVPRNKRRDMMRVLGYDYHPALNDGRVHNTVLPDGGKPRLYIKEGHLALNVTKPADVAKMYTDAQGKAMAESIGETKLGA